MKTILITGGAGFIGRNLCEKLLQNNHRVLCIDNLRTSKYSNIQNLNEYDKFSFYNLDVSKTDFYSEFSLYHTIDEIYHLASPASPPQYQKYALETIKANVDGTFNVCNLALNLKCPILFSSTSEVYGDPTEHPQKETYYGNVNSFGPRSMYDESKRCAEAIIWCFREKGLKTRIARIFNTYGPWINPDDGRMVPNFIKQALKGEALTIFGDGQQTRSLCYVDDLVDGLIKLMASDYSEPVNLGNPVEKTVLEIAMAVFYLVNNGSGCVIPLVRKKFPQNDPLQRCPDISRAKEILKWEPKISLDIGLRKTIEWFKTECQIQNL